MIDRYQRPEMASHWSEKNRYLKWLVVEKEVCEALAGEGWIPEKAWSKLKKGLAQLIDAGGVDPERVSEIEKTTRHDLIAFTTAVAEAVGIPESRYVHFGLTSSDVLDTALALQLQDAGKLILTKVTTLRKFLLAQAKKYQGLPTIGRSHGIWAEPTSFGLKFLGWYVEWTRNQERFERALEKARVGKLSGAVGVNSHWSPAFEAKILKKLGLSRDPVSTQVVPRDYLAEVMGVIAIMGSSIERMAVELRHLQRSEVGEVLEGFAKGQKGSSAMPHKRNPISAENLTGCARMLRGYLQPALENIVLWHERDISHSSVERVFLPDAFILLDYALHRAAWLIENLVVNETRVKDNLTAAGPVVFSGHVLLELVKKGANREESYYWVQECAHQHLEGKGKFMDLLSKHSEIKKVLSPAELNKIFSLDYQLRHVKEIYQAVSESS